MVDSQYWIWLGNAGHFINAERCLFHLSTIVGLVQVSTIGELYPRLGQNPNDKGEMQVLGGYAHDAEPRMYYETLVWHYFGQNENDDPIHRDAISCQRWQTHTEANRMHLATCYEWVRRQAKGGIKVFKHEDRYQGV